MSDLEKLKVLHSFLSFYISLKELPIGSVDPDYVSHVRTRLGDSLHQAFFGITE